MTARTRVWPRQFNQRPALHCATTVVGAAVLLTTLACVAGLILDGHSAGLEVHALRHVAHLRNQPTTTLAKALTLLGSLVVLGPGAALAVLWLAMQRRRRSALFLLTVTVGIVAITNLVKVIVDRSRPATPHLVAVASASFPSQHAAQATVVLPALALTLLTAGRVRSWTVAGAVLAAVAIGLSRIYLGVHYPSDVLVGWLLGTAWLALTWSTLARPAGLARPRPRAPRGPPRMAEDCMEPDRPGRRRRFLRTRQGSGTAARQMLGTLEAIKPDFRLAVAAFLVALSCLTVGDGLGGIRTSGHLRLAVLGLTLGFAAAGIVRVRATGREIARISQPRIGVSAASAIRLLCSVIGYALTLLGVLQLLNVSIAGLLVGGAVTGVVVGIAAQQSLANFFAGLVLLFARPYTPGQRVTVHSGALGGPFQGVIIDAGLMYTTMITENGPTKLPNAGLLAAAIEPVSTDTTSQPPGPAR